MVLLASRYMKTTMTAKPPSSTPAPSGSGAPGARQAQGAEDTQGARVIEGPRDAKGEHGAGGLTSPDVSPPDADNPETAPAASQSLAQPSPHTPAPALSSAPDGPASTTSARRLIAFDLDGTLTWTDSFVTFLRAREGAVAFRRGALGLAAPALRYATGRLDRDALKQVMIARFLTGVAAQAVRLEAASFWESSMGDRLLRADGLAALRRHVADGDEVTLVTACPELVAAPLAERLGVACLGTQLATTGPDLMSGALTGQYFGFNCRGPEKVLRLKAAYGENASLDTAYGDSRGDREMLAAARDGRLKPFHDGPTRPLASAIRLWW